MERPFQSAWRLEADDGDGRDWHFATCPKCKGAVRGVCIEEQDIGRLDDAVRIDRLGLGVDHSRGETKPRQCLDDDLSVAIRCMEDRNPHTSEVLDDACCHETILSWGASVLARSCQTRYGSGRTG